MSTSAKAAFGQSASLERGEIVIEPCAPFALDLAQRRFLSPQWLDSGSKNISFNLQTGRIGGTSARGEDYEDLRRMLERFARTARDLADAVCPAYRDALDFGRTSFRPAAIDGRKSSWRKDDTRLHIDAFPSSPLGGRRILRVFVNAGDAARHWRTGESFTDVARRFLPGLRPPFPGSAWLLKSLRITKGWRTQYDHFMLGIHDAMKGDQDYQARAQSNDVYFPPGAAWLCFTDSVSHAALAGQFAFEQTFYLPVSAMQEPEQSPLRILEGLLSRPLA